LKLVPGSKEGVDIGIWTDSLTVGRSTNCDVIVADQRFSSKHCIFWREGEIYFVKDTSSNGIYFGEQRIEKNVGKEIEDGQRIAMIRNMTDEKDYIKFEFRTKLKYRLQFVSSSHAQISPTSLWSVKSTRNRMATYQERNVRDPEAAGGSSTNQHHQERSPEVRQRTTDDNDAQTSARTSAHMAFHLQPWARLLSINKQYDNAWLNIDTTYMGRQGDCHRSLRYLMPSDDFAVHKNISAHHCAIHRKDGEAFIQDLGTNGTFLNGERLPPRVLYGLKDGDEIVLLYADDVPELREQGSLDRHGKLVHIGYIFHFTT